MIPLTSQTEVHLHLIAPLFEQLKPLAQEERLATANALEQMIHGVQTYLSAAPQESHCPLQAIYQRLTHPHDYEPSQHYQLQFQTTLIMEIKNKIQELRTKEAAPPPKEGECRLF